MATGDKIVNLDDLKAVYDKVDGDVGGLKSAFEDITSPSKNLWTYGDQSFTKLTDIYIDPPLPAGTYTLSAVVISTGVDNDKSRFVFGDSDFTNNVVGNLVRNVRSNATVTTTFETTRIQLMAEAGGTASLGDRATWSKIQVEIGESATEYAPPYTAKDDNAREIAFENQEKISAIADMDYESVLISNSGIESKPGCIRGIDSLTGHVRYYSSTPSQYYGDLINTSSAYAGQRTYKIPIDFAISIVSEEKIKAIMTNTCYIMTIVDANEIALYQFANFMATWTYANAIAGSIPDAMKSFVTIDENDKTTVDFVKIKKLYPNAAFVFFTIATSTTNEGYVKWNLEKYSSAITEKVQNTALKADYLESLIETPEIIVPNVIFAVAGKQFNLFYKGLILAADYKRYSIKCQPTGISHYYQYERGFRFTPSSDQVGDHVLDISIIDKLSQAVLAKKQVTIKVIAETTGTAKKIMYIGDSHTRRGIYAAEIQYNLSNGNFVSVGTLESTCTINGQTYTVMTEGRNSWSVSDYLTKASYQNDTNAFWNPSTQKFDFSYYMNNNENVDVPDVVCLNLGTNTDDTGVDGLEEMKASIKEYNSNIIVLYNIAAVGADQNGWGSIHMGLLSDTFRMSILKTNKLLINNLQNDMIAVPGLMLDYDYDYPKKTESASSRNPTQITIDNDSVHPSEYGYLHFADAYYNILQHWLFTS